MDLNNKIEAFQKIRGTMMMKPQYILDEYIYDSEEKPTYTHSEVFINDSNDLDKEEYKHFLDYHHTPRHN